MSPNLDLVAKQEITEVLYRYCRAVDRFDLDLLRSVYHEDAVDLHGVFNGPVTEFVAFFGSVAGNGSPYVMTHHQPTNILIELDGDSATAESYYSATHRRIGADGTGYDELVKGRYIDRFERRIGVWRVAHRTCVYDWSRIVEATPDWWDGTEGTVVRGSRDRNDPIYRAPIELAELI